MIEPGYYIFLFSDVGGYTSLRIYVNDKNLITDVSKMFTENFLDFRTYFRKTKLDTMTLVLNIVDEHGVSVLDFSGDLFEKARLLSYDDIVNGGYLEVVLNEIKKI